MRQLIVLTIMIVAQLAAQEAVKAPSQDDPKPEYRYLLVYREIESRWGVVNLNTMNQVGVEYVVKFEGFDSIDQAMSFLNSARYQYIGFPGGENVRRVRVTEEEFIGLYDLKRGGKIPLKMLSEEKSRPERVEIHEEKWTDRWWELQKK